MVENDWLAQYLAQSLAPQGELLAGLLMDAFQGQQCWPARVTQGLFQCPGEAAERGKLAVTKAQYGKRHLVRFTCDALGRVAGVRGRLAFPIGGGKDQNALGGRRGLEVLQSGGVYFVAVPYERSVQGLGKAPRAAAFTGDEDQRISLYHRAVVGNAHCLAASFKPYQQASDPEEGYAEASQSKDDGPQPGAFTGMQYLGPVIRALRESGVLPGKCLPTVAVDSALDPVCGDDPHVFRISGVRNIQLPEVCYG